MSFQLADFSKRKGEDGNLEWMRMRIENGRPSWWWFGTADSHSLAGRGTLLWIGIKVGKEEDIRLRMDVVAAIEMVLLG